MFEGLGAESYSSGDLVLTSTGSPETLKGARISANVFRVLGVRPVLGRDFLPEEESFGRHHVVLLSHEFWQHRFGGDPHIIGTSITLNSEATTVIGIMPPRTYFPRSGMDVWQPLAFEPWELQYRHAHNYRVLGKLKAGVSISQADQKLNLIASQLAGANLEDKGWGVEVHGLQEDMVGTTHQELGVAPPSGSCGHGIAHRLRKILPNLLMTRYSARLRESCCHSISAGGKSRPDSYSDDG